MVAAPVVVYVFILLYLHLSYEFAEGYTQHSLLGDSSSILVVLAAMADPDWY